uniref:Putative secreted protein n=1 Tax=Ixodes ricinus TaxID=34613 RepID=A0A6B0ULP1_IXORI
MKSSGSISCPFAILLGTHALHLRAFPWQQRYQHTGTKTALSPRGCKSVSLVSCLSCRSRRSVALRRPHGCTSFTFERDFGCAAIITDTVLSVYAVFPRWRAESAALAATKAPLQGL